MIETGALIEKFQYALDNGWGYILGTAGVAWTSAKQKQKVDYMVNRYGTGWKNNSEAKDDRYYQAAVNGSRWVGHTVADCSGLFKWAFSKLGGTIYHGSNTIWNQYCTKKGKLTNGVRADGEALKPGTAVFVYKPIGNNRSHIGLYIGGGKVIEAATTTKGVILSDVTDKKWAEWGELKGVTYDGVSPEPAPDPKPSLPTLRRGSKGQAVIDMQTMLYRLGYSIGTAGIDGDFGSGTEKAVKEFQYDHRLTVDGICGKNTWAALEKAFTSLNETPQEKTYTVCIHGLDKTQALAMKANYPSAIVTEE